MSLRDRRHPRLLPGEFDFFLVSLFSLYLEILLIRWVGTEIRIFSYFSNLVLVVCFFGLGVGYASNRLRLSLPHMAWLLAILFAITHPALERWFGFRSISEAVASGDLNTWMAPQVNLSQRALGFLRLAVVLVLIALIFVPFGRVLGAYFEGAAARIRAYSVNVAGSIAGIWLFAVLSFAEIGPVGWFCVAGALLLLPLRREPRALAVAAGGAACGLLALATSWPADGRTLWSAYQKLTLRDLSLDGTRAHVLEVNNTLYQFVLDLSNATLDRATRALPPAERPYHYYNLPYRLHPHPRRVLVVGAGTGNDVAAALRNGAEHIDAVEIDSAIVDIGRRVHPERPYDDPRVRVVVDDARAFFKRAHEKYDLIVFGLLDSHKLTSNFSNINLDSYVYTVESFREANALLADGGAIVVAFQTFFPYISWRLHDTIREATGRRPVQLMIRPRESMLEGIGGEFFFVGDEQTLAALRSGDPQLDRALQGYADAVDRFRRRDLGPEKVQLATDDWPYLYAESARVPDLWLAITGIVLALALVSAPAAGLSLRRLDGQFFFLGAAFLFLETHTITRIHLFFGTTWLVSSIVISAILAMVLVGNAIVVRYAPARLAPWYAGLLAAALLNWLVRPDWLRALGSGGGAAACALLAALPLLFAAVVFGASFARARDVRYAMSSNLLGSLAGGLAGCVSFVTGLHWVGLLAVAFYALSFAFVARDERAAA